MQSRQHLNVFLFLQRHCEAKAFGRAPSKAQLPALYQVQCLQQGKKFSPQAFSLQCLPTHHGGSVYAGALPDYNDGENHDDNDNDNDHESFDPQVADMRT